MLAKCSLGLGPKTPYSNAQINAPMTCCKLRQPTRLQSISLKVLTGHNSFCPSYHFTYAFSWVPQAERSLRAPTASVAPLLQSLENFEFKCIKWHCLILSTEYIKGNIMPVAVIPERAFLISYRVSQKKRNRFDQGKRLEFTLNQPKMIFEIILDSQLEDEYIVCCYWCIEVGNFR